MIYGPYSTGWRDGQRRRLGMARRAWLFVGVAATLAAFGGAVALLGVL
ncbi:MAG: hypothetical protein U0932_01015 [Thiobacillus sp.]|nr:hypothetical protein [Thiobacillus sp.]